MFRDYYEILGAGPDSTRDEIKRLYRLRAREAHPDRHPENSLTQNSEMSLINEAYSVLYDHRKRAAYDLEWYRHYRMKGLVSSDQHTQSISSNTLNTSQNPRETHSLYFDEKIALMMPDQRILLGILIALLIILFLRIL